MSAAPERLVVAREHAGLRADVYLALRLPGLSRTRIRQKVQTGESSLNGRRYATSARLREGDEITILWRGPLDERPAPTLAVLYEDAWLLALDKPAGVASHPMGRIQSGTAIQFVRERDSGLIREHLARGDAGFYPRLVHRLDMLTSGVLLVARTREAFLAMQRLVQSRAVAKSYLALVEGTVQDDEGRIELPLGRDESSAVRVKMAARCADGLPALTEFKVVRRLPGHTLLRAFPVTGRQHQVRVHLAAIGHPVAGDLLYKGEALFIRRQDCLQEGSPPDPSLPARHLLHAERVSFVHPFTGQRVTIDSPLPPGFTAEDSPGTPTASGSRG